MLTPKEARKLNDKLLRVVAADTTVVTSVGTPFFKASFIESGRAWNDLLEYIVIITEM